MGNNRLSGVNLSSGKNFTGQRQPVHPMPLRLKAFLRSWCDMNGMFLSEDSTYMVFNHIKNGKSKLIKLTLEYHKSTRTNEEFIFARNRKAGVNMNVTGAMSIQKDILSLGFNQEVTDLFTDSINQLIKT